VWAIAMGLKEDDEPTDYGGMLEALIDKLWPA
jgi:hypothetical protein